MTFKIVSLKLQLFILNGFLKEEKLNIFLCIFLGKILIAPPNLAPPYLSDHDWNQLNFIPT